jgi:hypothetical protein
MKRSATREPLTFAMKSPCKRTLRWLTTPPIRTPTRQESLGRWAGLAGFADAQRLAARVLQMTPRDGPSGDITRLARNLRG